MSGYDPSGEDPLGQGFRGGGQGPGTPGLTGSPLQNSLPEDLSRSGIQEGRVQVQGHEPICVRTLRLHRDGKQRVPRISHGGQPIEFSEKGVSYSPDFPRLEDGHRKVLRVCTQPTCPRSDLLQLVSCHPTDGGACAPESVEELGVYVQPRSGHTLDGKE